MKRVLVVGGALLVVGAGVIVASPSLVPQQMLRESIAEGFFETTGWRLRLDGRSDVSVLPNLTLQIDNVGIAGASAADGFEFARAERVDLHIGWLGVIAVSPEILSATIIKPRVDLEFDRSGQASWRPVQGAGYLKAAVGADEQPKAVGPFATLGYLQDLAIEKVSIVDGEVNYRDGETEGPVTVGGINASLLNAGSGGALTLDGNLVYENVWLGFDGRIGSTKSLAEGLQTAVDVTLNAGDSGPVNFKGQLAFGSHPVGSLQVSSDVPEFSKFMAAVGRPNMSDVGPLNIEGGIRLRDNGIQTKGMRLEIGSLAVSGRAQLSYLEDGLELKGDVSGGSLPFATLLNLAGVAKPSSGVTELDVSFYGLGRSLSDIYEGLELEGQAAIKNGRIAGLTLPELVAVSGRDEAIEDIDLKLDFSRTDAPVALSGKARWQGEPVDFNGTLSENSILDIKAGSKRFLAGYEGSLRMDEEALPGRFSFSTDALDRFANWYGKDLPDYLSGQRFQVSGSFTEKDRTLEATDLLLTLDGLRVSGDGSVTSGEKPLVRGSFDVSEVVLDRVMTRFKPSTVGGERVYDLSALRSLDVDVDLLIRRFKAGDLRATNAQLTAFSEEGRLTIDLANAEVYGGQSEGRILLNGATVEPSLSADLSLAKIDSSPFLASVSDLPQIDGQLNAIMNVSSTGKGLDEIWSNLNGAMSFRMSEGTLYDLDLDGLVRSVEGQTIEGWPLSDGAKTAFSTWGADVVFADGRAQFEALTLQSDSSLIEGRGDIDLSDGRVNWQLMPSFFDQASNGEAGAATTFAAAEVPLWVHGDFDKPSFSQTAEAPLKTASLPAGLVPSNEDITQRLAERLAIRQLTRAEVKPEVEPQALDLPVREVTESSPEVETVLDIDGVAVAAKSEELDMVPPQKPIGVAAPVSAPAAGAADGTISVAGTKAVKGEQRTVVSNSGGANGDINVQDVAAGTADDDAILKSIEEAWGVTPGYLTGNE
ncbi:AsmA family protein [Rhodobacteraceae bacterium RKSG542]|uniref:AsmA family protein n=1 Tax=Pseudovibrio flavus TaxID=2529854 RepID=UPI0012BCA269|nr:AsmA-like C-terminal region-containing protein [Pseudovibrio flavus]MTI16872.1 AsmA family protein [Pseudovibrio flavus]